MNNSQFKKLVSQTPNTAQQSASSTEANPQRELATAHALGSRMRSTIPMTPRSVVGFSGNDFAQQLAERNAQLGASSAKKFRSSIAPKGTKLRSGYQDRTRLRTSDEEDEKAVRVRALEEMVKLGQMEYATFQNLRDEIVGGDMKDIHLVKGLDYKLLKRVRQGENVLASVSEVGDISRKDEGQEAPLEVDVDDELERLEGIVVGPAAKAERHKKGEMTPRGQKRTRDDILRDLRASRIDAAAESKAQQPCLGPRFSKVGQKHETSRFEKDEKGREILITTDIEGNMKRKVKKANINKDCMGKNNLLMPDKKVAPLGSDVISSAPPPVSPENDGEDIFEGIGTDYNPLGEAESADDESEHSDMEQKPKNRQGWSPHALSMNDTSAMPPPSLPNKIASSRTRRYFGDQDRLDKTSVTQPSFLEDPNILAALKKASNINSTSSFASENGEELAKIARRKEMLNSYDRDADDMDMSFGNSRFGDEEDGEEGKVKLSSWEKDEDKTDAKGEVKGKSKKVPKKRKGDVNIKSVLRLVEGRG